MKILATTSTRADYDLLSGLYQLLNNDPEIDFKLLVYGAHLSKNHGYSVQQIQEDQLPILCRIETLITSDTAQGQIKTASLLMQNSVDIISTFNPDVILYVGDREDVIINAIVASFLQIPSIHFWGGDHASDGNIDNLVRHAASKFATFHFVSLEQHKNRLIRIGENPNRIFNVGSIALDRFVAFPKLSKSALLARLNLDRHFDDYALLIFHPFPTEIDHYALYFENIIVSLLRKGLCIFMSAPNTDPGNNAGFNLIEKYKNHPKIFYYRNIDRHTFISIYKNAKFIIGNSSSGITEAASIPLPAINVGERQRGRFCGENVVFTAPNYKDITSAITLVTSDHFLEKVKSIKNPYGSGQSAKKAYALIKQLKFKENFLKCCDPLDIK